MADDCEKILAEPIPVCTLFNDGSAPSGEDVFTEAQTTGSEADVPVQSQDMRKSSEPKLCNVFAEGSPTSEDDIFAKLSESHTSGIGAKPMNEIKSDEAESENVNSKSLPPCKSVDSFIVEELNESEVGSSENLNQANVPTPSSGPELTDRADDADGTQPSNSERDLKDPIIASPSFISVTSFSVSPDESLRSEIVSSILDDEISDLVSDTEGLTIENVAVSLDTKATQMNEESHTDYAQKSPVAGTESLFSNDQPGHFFDERVDDMEEDDPFAAALNNSARDRRRDAWLPSQSTASVLLSCLTDQVAPNLGPDNATRPGLSTSERLEDPVKQMVVKLTGSENVVRRENLTLDDVSQDKIGVEKLMETGNHRSAANLCANLLSYHGQGFGQATQMTRNTPDTLLLWYCRIYILVKLKLYEMAAIELAHFGNLDSPDMYYEFYPKIYPGRRGSMVPFEFRVLHAEFPRYVEKPQESLRRLHHIFATCEKIICALLGGKTEMGEPLVLEPSDVEASISFWTKRKVNILYCIGNTLVQLKDYVLAVKTYERILSYSPEDTVELRSGIGRLYLHIGDMRAAQQNFMIAEKEAGNNPIYKEQLLLNGGFMCVGTNNWRDAYSRFQCVLDSDPHNISAINNKAVCLLYLGKLKEAISVLESGTAAQNTGEARSKVQSINRHQTLIQGVIGNLSTLYELESSQFVVKKRGMFLKHIAQNCGDSFEPGCFKGI